MPARHGPWRVTRPSSLVTPPTPRDFLADDRRDLCAKQLDGVHHFSMREGADAKLQKQPLMLKDFMLKENLRGDFVRGTYKVGAA